MCCVRSGSPRRSWPCCGPARRSTSLFSSRSPRCWQSWWGRGDSGRPRPAARGGAPGGGGARAPGALLGTAPLTAFHFHQVSLAGLVANPLAVPLFGSVVVGVGLVAALLEP